MERIEPVRIDHPKVSDGRVSADVTLRRTAEGFEYYTSFGGRIYHGVSADGQWLVLDYYPTIASGTRPSVSRVGQAILCVLSRRRPAASSVNATRRWNRSAHTLIGGARHFRSRTERQDCELLGHQTERTLDTLLRTRACGHGRDRLRRCEGTAGPVDYAQHPGFSQRAAYGESRADEPGRRRRGWQSWVAKSSSFTLLSTHTSRKSAAQDSPANP